WLALSPNPPWAPPVADIVPVPEMIGAMRCRPPPLPPPPAVRLKLGFCVVASVPSAPPWPPLALSVPLTVIDVVLKIRSAPPPAPPPPPALAPTHRAARAPTRAPPPPEPPRRGTSNALP